MKRLFAVLVTFWQFLKSRVLPMLRFFCLSENTDGNSNTSSTDTDLEMAYEKQEGHISFKLRLSKVRSDRRPSGDTLSLPPPQTPVE